ncbi:hypothetical protein LMG29542_06306 [Paraburkholderia humisilvae]|uniref:Uncharacterized protein n=1 Tax=Paraburkholderia humisilvae TaxID=627669 RepID=A0A6J5EUN2_9BURK|nr:hypothetical protein LMG29542_06306 [Paraburkholderia humisilvae]
MVAGGVLVQSRECQHSRAATEEGSVRSIADLLAMGRAPARGMRMGLSIGSKFGKGPVVRERLLTVFASDDAANRRRVIRCGRHAGSCLSLKIVRLCTGTIGGIRSHYSRSTTAARIDAKRTLSLAEHVGEQRPSLMVSPFAIYAEIAW